MTEQGGRRLTGHLAQQGLTRRQWLLGSMAVAAAGGFAARPALRGAPPGLYFKRLQLALEQADIWVPTLVIDQLALKANTQTVKQRLAVHQLPCRLVVKSLPCLALLQQLSAELQTQRFMVFNLPMLDSVLAAFPEADVLFGKPMPAPEVAHWVKTSRHTERLASIQWLVDSASRVQEYAALATTQPLRINLELDVGLHRGGFPDSKALGAVLQQLSTLRDRLSLAGIMAYDAHVAKLPSLFGLQADAWQTVQSRLADARTQLTAAGYVPDQLTLNAGGSPTYQRHAAGTRANEVAIGSAFVQPSHFDDTVSGHVPACFIATPVLKVVEPVQIPGIEWLSAVSRQWDRNAERGYFIHGGQWLADPVSPAGLERSSLYGVSSNQELWMGSKATGLTVNDRVFFRPTQSEAVLLQFGDVQLYDSQRSHIEAAWPVFPVSA